MIRALLIVFSVILLSVVGQSCTFVTENKTGMNDNTTLIHMLVGTYTSGDSEGIYVYEFNVESGESSLRSSVRVDNPSYLAVSENEKYVYAVSENGNDTDAVNAFSLDVSTGHLTFINSQLTHGSAPCYVAVDDSGKYVVTANYLGGNISVFQTMEDGSLQPNHDLIRFESSRVGEPQKQLHLHCVIFSADNKYLFASDLGSDKIYKFETNKDASEPDKYLGRGTPQEYSLKPGSGPRHLEFHPNNKYLYLITELSGDVVVFDYTNGNINEVQTIKADDLNAEGSADIHISPDGLFLYASNRLKGDGIAIFGIDEKTGRLTRLGYQKTGIHPRNFAITPNGKFLLVACRDSNVIQVFERNMESGLLTHIDKDIELDKPVCIKFASWN